MRFAVSQQSVCIKSFPVAFFKTQTFAQALMLSIVSLQKGRTGLMRVSQSEVGIFKNALTNLNIKRKLHNVLYSLADEVCTKSARTDVPAAMSL